MAAPAVGAVVLVRFPFSDLTRSKLRPAVVLEDVVLADVVLADVVLADVVLADVGRGDYMLCQITSNRYADPSAVELRHEHFSQGGLLRTSYARPGKLFTANGNLIVREAGALKVECRRVIVESIEKLLRKDLP